MTDTIPSDSTRSARDAAGLVAATTATSAPASALPGWEVGVAPFGLIAMTLLAISVGVITGIGAFAFRELIGLVHNLFFLGRFSFAYDSSVFTPFNPWGPWVVLVPAVGALGVTFIIANFAPEAKGHGVPEVMDAIYYNGGRIRPIVAVAKSLASALAIGSGAAVGREGPIIQIGSALGSTLGQLIRMPAGQRITLVAAGAGAGIAATFNTPIGGVMFAIELMLPEVSVNTFLPVAAATGTATFIGRLVFGPQPAFSVPAIDTLPLAHPAQALATLCLYVLLGALCGVAGALFIKTLHLAEDVFEKVPGRYTRHVLGMLLLGGLIYGLHEGFGHYFVEGVGYSTIQAILNGWGAAGWLLALLFVCKLFATSTSLGAGSSGGIFSPSLFMGSTLGAAFATSAALVFPGLGIDVPAFAMVGMGAMVGGSTGAAMTAVTMIFEMTLDYHVVLPMILAVAAGLGVRRALSRENIYTAKLVGRGHVIPKALHANMFLVRAAKDVMETGFVLVPAETRLDAFLQRPEHRQGMRHVIVTSGDRILGAVRINTGLRSTVAELGTGVTFGEVANQRFTIVRESDVAFDVINRLWRKNGVMALVVRGGHPRFHVPRAADITGVITKEHVADAVAAGIQAYPR
ncbi:MAG TPA: chloride channel protein [Candidatus Sulfotelmatobacter sp.]|nr:chloride channel protein [Candidatus Sulfotelmatobacter sp.]